MKCWPRPSCAPAPTPTPAPCQGRASPQRVKGAHEPPLEPQDGKVLAGRLVPGVPRGPAPTARDLRCKWFLPLHIHPVFELLGTGRSECQQPVAGGSGNATSATTLAAPGQGPLLPSASLLALAVGGALPGVPAVSSSPALSGCRLGGGARGKETVSDWSHFICEYLCLLLVAVFHPWSAHVFALLLVFLKNWVWDLFIELTVVSLVFSV